MLQMHFKFEIFFDLICILELLSAKYVRNFQIGLTNANPLLQAPSLNGYEICARVLGALQLKETKTIKCIGKGRYLIVQMKGHYYLSLCEVEVYNRYEG